MASHPSLFDEQPSLFAESNGQTKSRDLQARTPAVASADPEIPQATATQSGSRPRYRGDRRTPPFDGELKPIGHSDWEPIASTASTRYARRVESLASDLHEARVATVTIRGREYRYHRECADGSVWLAAMDAGVSGPFYLHRAEEAARP